jgi:serine/threonine-protein kinase
MDLSSAPPTALGKYQIRGTLGRGAMGTVYDGWDPVIGRRVAIKTVRLMDHADPEAKEGLERFKREAQAAGRLSHPNIVGVYDYGETDETAYIVMEFIEGQSLKQMLDARERFPVAETVRIMEQMLAGLQFSHDSGVVHRDIKPGNVMIAKGGRVKLADFGIARIESSVMTQDGTMLGTPAYMSPEQLMALTVDARSDLYSAGVVLYQLLTGERPFEGGLTAIIHKALNTVPPRPSEIAVTAPPSLDAVVARAMAKRPADRYPDADSFAHALRTAFEAPSRTAAAEPELDDDATVVARPTPVPTPAPAVVSAPPPEPAPEPDAAQPPAFAEAPAGPNKALIGGLAAALLLVVGGGAWFALRPSAPQPAPVAAIASPPPATPPAAAPPAATPQPPPAAQTAPAAPAPTPTPPAPTPAPPVVAAVPPAPTASLPPPTPPPAPTAAPHPPAHPCAGAGAGSRKTGAADGNGGDRAAQSGGGPRGAGRPVADGHLRHPPLQPGERRPDQRVRHRRRRGARRGAARGGGEGRRRQRPAQLADAAGGRTVLRRAGHPAADRAADQPALRPGAEERRDHAEGQRADPADPETARLPGASAGRLPVA